MSVPLRCRCFLSPVFVSWVRELKPSANTKFSGPCSSCLRPLRSTNQEMAKLLYVHVEGGREGEKGEEK